MAAGFLPIIGLLAAYQYLIAGSPFHSTYVVMNDTVDPSVPSLSLEPELVVLGVMLVPVRLAELMDAAVLYARPHTDINAVREAFPDPTRAGELVKVMP